MFVKIWGSRGSTPVSGPEYETFGCDTACVEIQTRAGDTILLDAGTGLGSWARSCREKRSGAKPPVICLSHLHLDHIQGLPYYPPLYSQSLTIYGPRPNAAASLKNGLERVFDGVLMPVFFDSLKDPRLQEVKSGEKFGIGSALVETMAVNHPGGGLAWKITADGWTLVYSGDHEIPLGEVAGDAAWACNKALLDFMAGADLLIVDAHFSEADHKAHPGWGHSHFEQWANALKGSGARNVVFTHFNPEYPDVKLETIIGNLAQAYPDLNIRGASPGMLIDLSHQAESVIPAADCPICGFFQRVASLSDTHSVVDTILAEARLLARADAGTIYLLENNELVFAAAQNDSLFPKSAANKYAYMNARMPVSKASLAGYVALTGQKLNIPDVWNLPSDSEYVFNRDFDLKTGYRTRSVLCVPLVNSKNVIVGILQLINSRDGDKSVPFSEKMAETISRLAAMATIPLEKSLLVTSIILRMLQTSALRDPKETAGHVYRVGSMAAELYHHWAEKRGIEPEELLAAKGRLRLAAMLHDVGKVGIPDAVLKKPGRLDDTERSIMQRHSALGASLFSEGASDIDMMAKNIALHHHAKWDGTGYTGNPDIPSPAGKDIPLEARITAIADVYDALVSKRCYKEAWAAEKALEILRQDAGSHFDPELVACFEEITDTIKAIMERYAEKA